MLSSIHRLFLEMTPDSLEKRKMLPLKCQQTAFENVYLKAQEGMRLQVNLSFTRYSDRSYGQSVSLSLCSPWCVTEEQLS